MPSAPARVASPVASGPPCSYPRGGRGGSSSWSFVASDLVRELAIELVAHQVERPHSLDRLHAALLLPLHEVIELAVVPAPDEPRAHRIEPAPLELLDDLFHLVVVELVHQVRCLVDHAA